MIDYTGAGLMTLISLIIVIGVGTLLCVIRNGVLRP